MREPGGGEEGDCAEARRGELLVQMDRLEFGLTLAEVLAWCLPHPINCLPPLVAEVKRVVYARGYAPDFATRLPEDVYSQIAFDCPAAQDRPLQLADRASCADVLPTEARDHLNRRFPAPLCSHLARMGGG